MQLFNNLTKQHYFLIGGWIFFSILQAIFTNLHPDEAYYWMYSKQLDWGYWDHPPMAAFVIFLGDSIVHSQLGVRLFIILLSSLSFALIMNELNEKKDLFFLVLFMLSFPLMHTHIGGFLALPDVPLVFFTLLFFLLYKRFSIHPNLNLTIAITFAVAAMIYSKYHALLILGLVVLSNLKLLRTKYFWIAVIGIVILLIPHFLWQAKNQFPTFMYHLTGHKEPVKLENFTNNIISQLAVAGPLTGVIVLYSLSKVKVKHHLFNRAILFNILGFYILLTLMSFRNWIEAHWTVALTPLLMIVTYPIISSNQNLKKWFKRLSLPIVILFFVFRFYMAADFIPNVGYIKFFFYKQEEKAMEIKKMAGDLQVASFNNFNFPGSYEFYTGDPAIHLAVPDYRFCQYDLWDEEESANEEPLFIVIPDRMDTTNLITLCNGQQIKKGYTPSFQSLKKLSFTVNNIKRKPNNLLLSINLKNNSGRTIKFEHVSNPHIGVLQNSEEYNLKSLAEITKKKQILIDESINLEYLLPNNTLDTTNTFVIFTKTIEKNRGEMLAVKLSDF